MDDIGNRPRSPVRRREDDVSRMRLPASGAGSVLPACVDHGEGGTVTMTHNFMSEGELSNSEGELPEAAQDVLRGSGSQVSILYLSCLFFLLLSLSWGA